MGFSTVQHTLYRALEIRPLVLKATFYQVCAGLIPISHLVKLRHRYITCLGFPISKWQDQDLNLGTLRIWDHTIALCCPSLCQCHFHVLVQMEDSKVSPPNFSILHTPHRPGHPGSLSSASLSLLFRIISYGTRSPRFSRTGFRSQRMPSADLDLKPGPREYCPDPSFSLSSLFLFLKPPNAPLSSYHCPAYKPPKPPHCLYNEHRDWLLGQ